jgi:hypothetical protein
VGIIRKVIMIGLSLLFIGAALLMPAIGAAGSVIPHG